MCFFLHIIKNLTCCEIPCLYWENLQSDDLSIRDNSSNPAKWKLSPPLIEVLSFGFQLIDCNTSCNSCKGLQVYLPRKIFKFWNTSAFFKFPSNYYIYPWVRSVLQMHCSIILRVQVLASKFCLQCVAAGKSQNCSWKILGERCICLKYQVSVKSACKIWNCFGTWLQNRHFVQVCLVDKIVIKILWRKLLDLLKSIVDHRPPPQSFAKSRQPDNRRLTKQEGTFESSF